MAIPLLADIPFLGSGLGYRRELEGGMRKAREAIDFVEVLTDKFLQAPEHIEELERICEVFPVVPHGIGLSIGSVTPLHKEYLKSIKRISDITRSPYYSEHLCVTRGPGLDIGHLSPLWLTEEALEHVIRNVNVVQEYLGKPLILENISCLMALPHQEMSEPEFFTKLVNATGCGVLLDVTNLYTNSVNHHFDPMMFLESMPLDRVVQVHIAGGKWSNGFLLDTHTETVQEESWRLLKIVCAKCPVKGVLLEHDDNFPEIEDLLHQVEQARNIVNEYRTEPLLSRKENTKSYLGKEYQTQPNGRETAHAITVSSFVRARQGHVFRNEPVAMTVESLDTGVQYRLNSVGIRIWNLVQQPIFVHDILGTLVEEYEVSPTVCERDLLAWLQRLHEMGFVEITDDCVDGPCIGEKGDALTDLGEIIHSK